MATKVPCPNCDGRGAVDLPDHLQETFDEVKRGNDTAIKIQQSLIRRGGSTRITANAYSNRLSDLRDLGLVTAHRDGRFLRYEIVKGKKR